MMEFSLNSGTRIPALGFGTWNIPSDVAGSLVKLAVGTCGYRHLDCAAAYGNEKEIGKSLSQLFSEGTVKREDLFITSKLWNSKHRPDDVRPALEKTLQDLQVDYLDLYLIHWPVAMVDGHGFPPAANELISLNDCPIIETWREMERAVKDGLVRNIGVSNFSITKLQSLLQDATIPPAVNQVECHPYLQLHDLHDFCDKHNIHITGYSPLGSPARPAVLSKEEDEPLLMEDSDIIKIAKKHDATPAQVLLHWGVNCGKHSVLCKSSSLERMEQNFNSLNAFKLDEEDRKQITSKDMHRRYLDGGIWCAPGGPYTKDNLWDEMK